MAENPASAYGKDIRCIADADDLFSTVEGIEVVAQDAIHAITSDDFLGPGGDGRGFDVRRLVGLPDPEIAAAQPIVTEVLERDDRINRADVVLESTTSNGLADVSVKIICYTDFGPFTITKSALQLTSEDIEGKTI